MRKTAMSLFASACLFLLLCCGAAARADVIINEVMASNGYSRTAKKIFTNSRFRTARN